jgi:hypothetical protein
MSDAARLARLAFEAKPKGVHYGNLLITSQAEQEITKRLADAVVDATYAAAISYAEALAGIRSGASSWSVVRLYYSSFYSIKALLLLNGIIAFNSGREMLLELRGRRFLIGGKSSHHLNWTSLRSAGVGAEWFCSQDSEEAYGALRRYRENVNYTHAFTDPMLHECLVFSEWELGRRFRTYRDDGLFFYTYLQEHMAIAYPTKLIFYLGTETRGRNLHLQEERSTYLQRIWGFSDRCPVL